MSELLFAMSTGPFVIIPNVQTGTNPEQKSKDREFLNSEIAERSHLEESENHPPGLYAETCPSHILTLTRSTVYFPTYFIYSFDGKLLAEYDANGICQKDYVYMGNKLIAEYQPVIAKYYYYTSDQINSTRIITDSAGTVVYSAMFDPYGGMQKEWVNTYQPSMKFSGKERESKSELDYFGARYYDHLRYRFISVDPVINKEEALSNPQFWNLYAYCGNNPITTFDPNGEDNYVFYDSKNWTSQAVVEANRLQNINGEKTNLVPANSESAFVSGWNSMTDPNQVTLIYHSGAGEGIGNTIAINADKGQYLVTNPTGKTPKGFDGTYIGNLKKYDFEQLNLYVCHGAVGENSLAKTFFKTQNVNTVRAANNSVNFSWWNYHPKKSVEFTDFSRKSDSK